MHELGLTRNIVSIAAEAARGRKVLAVTVEVGKLSGVMAEALAFCFDVVVKATPVEGARLNIRVVEGRALCSICGASFAKPAIYTPCPCGSRKHTLLEGAELNIKNIELEEEEELCVEPAGAQPSRT
jgi:hydrogenase nickel incorporation protein HypA/HybF